MNDAPRSGRPTEIASSDVKAISDDNLSQTVWDFSTALDISHTNVENNLRQP